MRFILVLILFLCLSVVNPNLTVVKAANSASIEQIFTDTGSVSTSSQTVIFSGFPAFKQMARIALIKVGGQIYAYTRQLKTCTEFSGECFDIKMAISNDDGKTFNIAANPVIVTYPSDNDNQRIRKAYDPDVIKLPSGYYMVFEGSGVGCPHTSTFLASSTDGLTWSFKGPLLCNLTPGYSFSTPTIYKTLNNNLYIQWVNVDDTTSDGDGLETSKHQIEITENDLVTARMVNSNTQLGRFPMSASGQWDDLNYGAGDVVYENGYYYSFYEGANSYRCDPTPPRTTSIWGLGVARSNDPGNVNSWTKYSKPLMLSQSVSSCEMGYPEILETNSGKYIYYIDLAEARFMEPDSNGANFIRRRRIEVGNPYVSKSFGEFVSQNVPNIMTVGSQYNVGFTFKNNSLIVWSEGNSIRLGSINPSDNTIWNPSNRIQIPAGESVNIGTAYEFKSTVNAPSTPGIYNIQKQMVRDGYTWFKDQTANVAVNVVAKSKVCKGDFDQNALVDVRDFQVLGMNYKKNGITCSLDIVNNDCYLNAGDLQRFALIYKKNIICEN